MEYKRVDSLKEYYDIKSLIIDIDLSINNLYNVLSNISELDKKNITEIQDYINRLKKRRLGYYILTKIFEKENNNNTRLSNEYFVNKGDTLAMISLERYGNIDNWQYIYSYNKLTSCILEPNQKLILPELHPNISNVYLKQLIEYLDNGLNNNE